VNRAAVGTRRTVVVVILAIALTDVLVAASTYLITSTPRKPDPFLPVSIAVVGDSYSAGIHNNVVWPTLLAQRTGWSVANFALPGAGYARDDLGGHAFVYQVDRAEQSHPQTIVIVGGIFDAAFANTGAVGVGAAAAVNKIKLSGRRALVIAPTLVRDPGAGRTYKRLRRDPQGSCRHGGALSKCSRPPVADEKSDAA
jgi:hypothetical protein